MDISGRYGRALSRHGRALRQQIPDSLVWLGTGVQETRHGRALVGLETSECKVAVYGRTQLELGRALSLGISSALARPRARPCTMAVQTVK